MTDRTQAPARQGSRARGALGALLGAFLAAWGWHMLMLFLPRGDWWEFLLFLGALVGLAGVWGYRLLRGYRSMGFARWTVRAAAVLAQPMALLATMMTLRLTTLAEAGRPVDGQALGRAAALGWETLWEGDSLRLMGMLALVCLFFCPLYWGLLLRYADPAWYSDPRRLARVGGGGAMFNEPPCWPLPAVEDIPKSFDVDKGRLLVEGERLTICPRFRAKRSFSVTEAAGVILGVPTGYNILYDKENRELARFAWSRENAVLFGQYLITHGVPFLDVNGAPVPTAPQAAALPRAFTVRESKLLLWLGWAGLVLVGGAAAACLLVLEGGERLLYTALSLFPLALLVSALLCYYNRRLEVDGEALTYTTLFGRTTRFLISDVKALRPRLLSGTRELLDQNGRRLARYEDNMENAALLVQYLSGYDIPLAG